MSDADLYLGREQTFVKHFILRKYLERFAFIVGTFAEAITYVDCFSGPWKVRSEELKDSSFSLALDELRKAREALSEKRRTLKLRCFFLEKDRAAYARLKEFADRATDAEIETRNCHLEEAINDIIEFVSRGGRKSFPFIFVDPTGWKGFAMSAIAPLLRVTPGEVLINFMTGHILRFIELPDEVTQDSFVDLFGSADFKTKLAGLNRQDREDAMVEAYAENVKKTGRFSHVCSAIVLHPEFDRTYFHLIYATRDPKGVEVFKGVEKTAMAVMEKARADAQQRQREQKSHQRELFGSEVKYESTRYDELRDRYLAQAKGKVQRLLQERRTVVYDEAWVLALTKPLVWESDLKEWVRVWEDAGFLTVQGKQPKQRVPHRDEQNYLNWHGPPRGPHGET